MANVIIMGAAGRDFHNFNVVYREREEDRVVAFTAAQIPNITDRTYPPQLAGPLYPQGIPIYPEPDLPRLVRELHVEDVVLSYSDISHVEVMHRASIALASGANFVLLGPDATMLPATKRVVAVTAVRTGAGKSPLVRALVDVVRRRGSIPCVVRHPMPYGALERQIAQRFATLGDLTEQACTIEEREEYEPHIRAGTVVFAGVDYAQVLRLAEAEADVIVWDGGNNDLPFFRPDLHIVVVDALRPGHELTYHPGEANARMADAFVITKVAEATAESLAEVRRNLEALNPRASVTEADLQLTVRDGEAIRGQRVLVIEDGPTITHGGMAYGAGFRAAQRFGGQIIDPRPWAVGSIHRAFEQYPHIGPVLPALGYGEEQLSELEATIRAVPCDVVLVASPVDLRRLLDFDRPSLRVEYDIEIVGGVSLEGLLARVELG